MTRIRFGSLKRDTLTGTQGNDLIFGFGSADLIIGSSGADILIGGAGNDTLFGDAGNDWLFGGSGDDDLYGGFGQDYLDGGSGADIIDGGSGNDTLSGGAGADQLFGGQGNDVLDGGSGNDTLFGGAGRDTVHGGSGEDVLVFVAADSRGAGDRYDGGSGADSLRLVLTGAEYASAALRAEIAAFLARPFGQFHFQTLNLSISGIERLEVYVDGTLVTPGSDTTPPPPPTIALAAVSDSGVAGDRITQDDTPTLSGQAEAGATVRILLGGVSIGSTTAAANGAWIFTVSTPLPQGIATFTATAADAAGNVSAASMPLVVTIDRDADVGDDLSITLADALINATERSAVSYVVAGLDADATAQVTFTGDGGSVQATVTGNGPRTINLSALGDGPVTVSLLATDAAGNTATASASVAIDATPPAAPVLSLASTDDTGVVGDGITRNGTITVSVAAEAGSLVRLGAQSAVAVGGVATFSVALVEGVNLLSATAEDAAGNVSGAGVLTITRDSDADVGDDLSITLADALINATERSAVSYVVAGLDADATAQVTFTGDGGSVQATVTGNGPRTINLSALGDGPVTVSLLATDAAGNTATASASVAIDATPPAAPTLSLDAASDTGAPGDGRTADSTPTLTGFAEAGATVTVLRDGAVVGSALTDGSGRWSFTDAALADGAYAYAARATDAAGNTGILSDDFALTIAPETGLLPITVALSESDEASAPGPNTTSAGRVTLIGQTTAGATVQLADGPQTSITTADVNGVFRFEGVLLDVGANPIQVSASFAGAAGSAAIDITRVAADPGAPDNLVLQWIREALETLAEESAAPTFASRALAIQSIAMHDVMAAIDGLPGQLAVRTAAIGTSAEAAVARAAHDVLVALFPGQRVDLAQKLAESLAGVPDGQSENDGIALGAAIAAEVLARRAGDGWNDVVVDVGSDQPGRWRPTEPFAAPGLDAQWATLDPFAMTSPDQFRTGAPPALDSQQFLDAFNQVKSLGSASSSTRTAEQTEIARFWAAGVGTPTPSGMWNEVAASLADGQSLGLGATATLFAKLNIAMADAAIAVWDAKYTYDFWRPVTAIRYAGDLDDARFVEDRAWKPLVPTPAFPEYTSGHAGYSGAAATILTATFGNQSFDLRSGAWTRSFDDFWDAANEAGMSRVYGGIHFEFSSTAGLASGRQIGEWVLGLFDTAADRAAPRILLDAALELIDDALPIVSGVVSDNLSGVRSLHYLIDGQGPTALSFGADGRFAVDLRTLFPNATDGIHDIAFFATDAAGNSSEVTRVSAVLATTDPVISLAPSSLQPGETIAVNERLTGRIELTEGNRLSSLTYSVDGGPARLVGFDAATGSFDEALDLRSVASGNRSVAITAVDAAGNSTTTTIDVVIPPLPFRIVRVGPEPNSMDVGVTYRPVLEFSRPVDPSTLTAASFYATGPDGAPISARIVPFADGLGAWLLFTDSLPGGSAIRLHIDGNAIRSIDGGYLDAADEGFGSIGIVNFTTVSTAAVPGTVIEGIVLDPGVDREMMTPDDVAPGPGGLNDWANNIWNNPLAGVKVYVLGREGEFVFTDAQGRFRLEDMPAGNVKLVIDGRTAPNDPAGIFFPEMVLDLTVRGGAVNTVMGSMGPRDAQLFNQDNPAVYLPRLDESMLTPLSTTSPTVITATGAQNTGLTGDQLSRVQLKVAPGSLVDEDGNPVQNAVVGIGSVPPSMVMDMLPPGVLQHSFDITIQAPGGAVFTAPAELTFPNIFDLAPGEKMSVLSFDHTTGRLIINGTATVAADGLTLTTDPDSGILAPGWHGLAPGTGAKGQVKVRCAEPLSVEWMGLQRKEKALADYGKTAFDIVNTANDIFDPQFKNAYLAGGKVALEVKGWVDDFTRFNGSTQDLQNSVAAGDWTSAGNNLLLVAADSSKIGFALAAKLGGKSKVGELAKWLGLGVGKARDLGESLTEDPGDMNYLPTDFQARVDAYNKQRKLAGWEDRFGPEKVSKAQQNIDNFLELYQRSLQEAQRQLPILDRMEQSLPKIERIVELVDIADPQGSLQRLRGLPDTERNDFVNGLQDFAEAGLDLVDSPNYDDLRNVVEQVVDALNDALSAMNDVLGMNVTMNTAQDQANGITVPPVSLIEELSYGSVFYAVIRNIDTGVEQRISFNPAVGIDIFLAPETPYEIVVYDTASNTFATAVFMSEATGQQTNIPTLLMVDDEDGRGVNGLTPTASYVLGLNPNRPDNLVPGISDAEAIRTGAADTPAIVAQTSEVARIDLQGDAKAIELVADGANNARLTAFVATGQHGFAIVDVSNPRALVRLAEVDLAGDATDIAYDASSGRVAVATGNGLAVYDVRDFRLPVAAGFISQTAVTQVVTVQGFAVVVSGGGVVGYDLAGRTPVSAGLALSNAPALALEVEGDRLYVLARVGGQITVAVYEASPSGFAALGSLSLAELLVDNGDGRISGRMSVQNGIVYLGVGQQVPSDASAGGYATIDARNPAAMALLSSADNFGIAGNDMAHSGTGIGVAVGRINPVAGAPDQTVLDVVSTANPTNTDALVRRIELLGSTSPTDVQVVGNMAFVTDENGLRVVQFQGLDRAGVAPAAAISVVPVDVDPSRPGIQVHQGDLIRLGVSVSDDQLIARTELLLNGRSVATDVTSPFDLETTLPTIAANGGSTVTLQVRATDTGGNTGLSAPLTVELVPNVTPFALSSSTPADGGVLSVGQRKLTFTFSKPLDVTTVSSSTFVLRDDAGVVIRPELMQLSNSGKTVEITYGATLAGTYALTIVAASIRSANGDTLGAADLVTDFNRVEFDTTYVGSAFGVTSASENWSDGTPGVNERVLVQTVQGGRVLFDGPQLPNDGGYNLLTVTGGGLFQIAEAAGADFRGILTDALDNSSRLVVEARGSLSVNDGDIFNSGRIELKANFIPYNFFAPGSRASMFLKGADITISGGGVIELGTADVTRGVNDLRTQIYAQGDGDEQLTAVLSRTRLTAVVNVDNTIRGGGTLEGNMTFHNRTSGVIESTLDTRLTIQLAQQYFFSQGAFSQIQYERATLTNEGLIRADASSTLAINFTDVANDGGRIQSAGDNSLLLFQNDAIVRGGVVESTHANASVFVQSAQFSEGALIDTTIGNNLLITGRASFDNVEIRGNVTFAPQDIDAGQSGSGFVLSFGGLIRNGGAIEAFDPTPGLGTAAIRFERDTIFTGGGELTLLDFEGGQFTEVQGRLAQYVWDDPALPPPDAPPPIRVINHNHTLNLTGVVGGESLGVTTVEVYDPDSGNVLEVQRPRYTPFMIENLSGGIIRSFLLLGDGQGNTTPRPATLQQMTIENSGLVAAQNLVTLTLEQTSINNNWYDYDPVVGVRSGDPTALGRVEANNATLVINDSSIAGGFLDAGSQGTIVVDGVSTVAGAKIGVGVGSTFVVRSDADAVLFNGERVTNGVTTRDAITEIDLHGELRIESLAGFGTGGELKLGGGFGPSVVTIRGFNGGVIDFATEAGAPGIARISGAGFGARLELSGVTIKGAGAMESGDGDLSVAVVSSDRVVFDNAGEFRIAGDDFTLIQGASVGMRGSGGTTVASNVENNGEFVGELTSRTIFEGDVFGFGLFIIDEDSTLVFERSFASVVEFSPFDLSNDGSADDGTMIIGDSDLFQGTVRTFGSGDRIALVDIDFDDASWQFLDNPDGTIQLQIDDGVDFANFTLNAGIYGSYDPNSFNVAARAEGGVWITIG